VGSPVAFQALVRVTRSAWNRQAFYAGVLSGLMDGDHGECRFRAASFDISVKREFGGRGCLLDEKGRTLMGAKAEGLAKQFEAKAREALVTLGKLGDADWKKVTAAEKWMVGVTAHHLAGGLEAVAGIVTNIVTGGPPRGNFTRAMLDEMNAQHAKEHANCTRAETLALFQKGAATASAVVRGLNDDQLAKSGIVFTDAPPMTAEQLIMRGLLGHIDDHMGSIRRTVAA